MKFKDYPISSLIKHQLDLLGWSRPTDIQHRAIKHILDGTRYSELGYPDGIRITLNAIETEDQIGDTNLDVVELAAQILVKDDKSIQRGYAPLGLASGLKKRLKVKTIRFN